MYICVCNAISDRQIRETVDQGAGSLLEVQMRLPVAACCGRCEDSAREVIESHIESANRPVAA
jgi:bacterioferritin-associated ferredoxin